MAIESQRKSRAGQITTIAIVTVVGLAAILVIVAQRPLTSVRAILWDREVCAQCGMTISDPRFACQLQTTSGDVYDFDDPGCLLTFLRRHRPHVRAIYFHALKGISWFKYPQVAFLAHQQSPMGYGLGAVAIGSADAIDFEAAQAYVTGKSHGRRTGAAPPGRGGMQ